ncbi:MAG TPA: PASTA domain-containing protein [Gaiellaceae bacterium]|jgi:hypothetical protein|nr:PASTA domain-containing protein [Gaiellaceae bacterium]
MKLPLHTMRDARFLLVCAAVGLAVLGATAVIANGAAASPAVNTKLFAYDNEPNEAYHGIWLKDANGVLVTHLAPGTYEIEVNDLSPNSSFHLTGPGVDIKTGVDFVGQTTWTVTFTNGIYLYHCDAMPELMYGSFTVDNSPPPPPPPPAKCVVPKVVGKSLAKAKRRLSAAHCRTGAVRHGQSRLPRGIVYWQSRKPGARLPRGTKIGMRVSL